MGPHNTTELIRSINLVLSIIAFVWLIYRRVRHNGWYSKTISTLRNDIWLMAFFWVCAVIVGTVEQLFQTGSSARVVFATAAVLVTLKLLIRPAEHWEDIEN